MSNFYYWSNDVKIENTLRETNVSRRKHKPILHLADPYFLPHGRLRVPGEIEIKLVITLRETPLDVLREDGDFFV